MMHRIGLRVFSALACTALLVALARAGSQTVLCYPNCLGGTTCWVHDFPDPTGEQRFAVAHMLPTQNGGIQVAGPTVEMNGTIVRLSPDSTVSLFYQTDPAYRAQMGPSDTWVGFSSTRLVPMEGFVSLRVEFRHLGLTDEILEETRLVQFSLVPRTYADTDDIAESVAATRIEVQFEGASPRPVTLARLLSPVENGRYVSNAGTIIPSDPPGAAISDTIYLPKAGDLVITEIMRDPENGVADDAGEWFEVENVSGVTLNLEGVTVRDDGSDYYQSWKGSIGRGRPVILSPGGRAVFGRKIETRLNGGAKVDIEYGNDFTLANTADEIILEVQGIGEIDRVAYSSAWPGSAGKSIELADTTADNNDSGNWTVASLAYGNQNQKGTPASPYNTAAPTPYIGDPGIPPPPGGLVITEITAQPRHDDANGEWFEVFNPLDTPVVLTNCRVEITNETGTSSFDVTTGTILDPGDYLVFSRYRNGHQGGMLFGYDYPDGISLPNDSGQILIKDETGTLIDRVAYDGDLFAGYPEFGNGVDGGWPMPSEYDGRSLALQGSLSDLRDTTGYDNNLSGNWAPTAFYKLNAWSARPIATPGLANGEDLSLSLSMPSQANAQSFADTFSVTITPPAGYNVTDIDTQSIRLDWQQKPIFLKIEAGSIRADFLACQVPAHITRNLAETAYITAEYAGDSPLRFLGTAPFNPQDTSLPTPEAVLSTPAPGEIQITEIMVNPYGDENAHEYFEVRNATAEKTFDLREMGVQDGGGTTSDSTPESRSRIYNRGIFGPLRLAPGDYLVVGRDQQPRLIGGYLSDAAFLNQDLNFANTGDQVVVFRLADGVVIAEVDYAAADFPSQSSTTIEGRALSLVAVDRDPALGRNWVNASLPHGAAGDSVWGTPSEPNRIAARAGDVLVSEVYADPPPGGEPNAEFFEVANPDTMYPIDLAGLVIEGDAGDTFALDDKPGRTVSGGPQRAHVAAGGVLVLGYSRGTADGVDATFDDTYGAGITGYDYPAWTLKNSSDAVRLVRPLSGGDTVLVHGMAYSSSAAGQSWGLASLSDTTTYVLQAPNPTVRP